VDTEHRYTHPLDGAVGSPERCRPAAARGWFIAEAVILLLLVTLFVLGIYAYRTSRAFRSATAALEAASGRVEFEPLSKEGDGSYEESEAAGKGRKALQRIRSWRARNE
jgi:hypothetical protein